MSKTVTKAKKGDLRESVLGYGNRTAAELRASPQFVREEMIANYRCFTLRMTYPQNPNSFIELSFTPELGNTPLKFVLHLDGGESVVEAIKVYLY